MAIRDDNTPPSGRTPGSITQNADSQIDRIGNISNVSKTVSNMQKDVKQRITETKQSVDEGQQISAVQKSMTTVLDRLADTVGALSSGIKTITVDTAKATKDTISQYGKAVSEDISFNKQNTVAMALAKTTPLYGYFAAKFMETDVFKKAAERMKASIGKVFGSLAGVFRRGGKGPGEDTNIPKMHSGGYVKKGGLTELHAGEVVAPIEKILKRIDDSISTTKDLAKITEKTALHMTTDLKGYIKSSSSSDKSQMNIFRSFIRTYKEVGERAFTEQPVERMARSLLAIQDTLGAQIGNMEQVWQEMLANHPTLVKLRLGIKGMTAVLTSPYKIIRAFMRVRGFGGYRTKLSKAKNPLQATAENIATLYVDLMWRLDNMMPLIKLSAQANRDVASKLTGNKYGSVKGIPREKNWSVNKLASKAIGTLPGMATSMLGQGLQGIGKHYFPERGMIGKIGRGLGKFGGGIDTAGQWLMEGGGEVGKKKRLKEMSMGAIPDLGKQDKKAGSEDMGCIRVSICGIQDKLEHYFTDFMPVFQEYIEMEKEITTWKLQDMRQEIERKNLESGVLLLEYQKAEEELPALIEERKNKKKKKKMRQKLEDAADASVKMASRLKKFLTKDRIMRWLVIAGTFISGLLTTAGTLIAGLFAPTGAIMVALMGIGPMVMTALAAAPFWVGILAALGGAGIGTAIQKWIIAPYLAKKEKEKRERQAKSQAKQAKNYQDAIKQSQIQPKSEADTKALAGQHIGAVRRKLHRIGVSTEAQSQMQGTGFFGEAEIHDIQQGMHDFRQANMHKYLLYDPDGIAKLRQEFDSNPNSVRTRNVFRGESGIEYGMFRERVFLAWLYSRGDQYKIASDVKDLGPELAKRAKTKKQLEYVRKFQGVNDPAKEATLLKHKRTGLTALALRKKEEMEFKVTQAIKKAKGIGTEWMLQLDSKSRQAFETGKKYYIKELGMSETEADMALQQLALELDGRFNLMTNPETYKRFGQSIKEQYAESKNKLTTGIDDARTWGEQQYQERQPGVKKKLELVADEVQIQMAGGAKVGAEYSKALKEQTVELVDQAQKTAATGSATVISSVNTAVTAVQQSKTVQGGMQWGRNTLNTGRDWVDDSLYNGATD